MKAFTTRLSLRRPGTKSNACSRSMPKIEQTRAMALTRSLLASSLTIAATG